MKPWLVSWWWEMMPKPFWSHEYHWFHPCSYCPWNDSTNMCRAYHLRNPQHETHLLNSLVGYTMRRIVGQTINITNTETAIYIARNVMHSCVYIAFHCWVIPQTRFLRLLNWTWRVYSSVNDANKILEKERSRNVVNALFIDAVESHLLQNFCEMVSIARQLV